MRCFVGIILDSGNAVKPKFDKSKMFFWLLKIVVLTVLLLVCFR